MLLSRRSFLVGNASAPALQPGAAATPAFRHRGYLGWITDLSSRPDPEADWPSMRLDARLLDDYRASLAVLHRLGFNEIVIWGLYVSRAWPVDIRSAVQPARGALVEKLIDLAHSRNLRVYSGLGVYSWGFEEILKAHPNLGRGDPSLLCASEPEAWRWMQKVVDYVFERFPIDGISMQSADQGRCRCDRCHAYSDAEYHALLNRRVAGYVRSRWPAKTIGVNSWGLRFEDPGSLPSLIQIGRSVDYIIDVHDSSRRRQPDYRRKIIQSVACDFGTLGGPQVEPPQHWRRDRWFLPTLRRTGEHLAELSRDGGRACEYFFHILANPGDELTLWVAGKMLSDPQVSWRSHAESSIEELYEARRASVRDALLALFLEAEEAYFEHGPDAASGTVSLEPLVSDRPGPPVYVTKRLQPAQRATYAARLSRLRQEAARLAVEVPRKDRVRRIIACLDHALRDVRGAG
jgi:hypothetical protein